jgi:hypothetical protein
MKKKDISGKYRGIPELITTHKHMKMTMEVSAVSSALGESCNERAEAAKKKSWEKLSMRDRKCTSNAVRYIIVRITVFQLKFMILEVPNL